MKKFFCILVLVFLIIPGFSALAKGSINNLVLKRPIKILLVPGHDNEVWGAQYNNLKEADMNLVLAKQIYDVLKKDKRFQVFITRDQKGYVKEFSDYFTFQKDNILAFKNSAKQKTENKITDGTFISKTIVPHNPVSLDTSVKLYGINKWANDNNIDAVLHIHFNDVPRKTIFEKAEYKGFSIYFPEAQMANSKESTLLAKSIFDQLFKKYNTSTLKEEVGGLIPDQKLIALGASGTLNKNVRSVLVEYGYIYRFGNSISRHKAYQNMASLTAQGIKNYFFK